MTNKLANAIFNQGNVTTTQNGDKAYRSTGDACLDFFSKAGGLMGNQAELLSLFQKAFAESPEAAIVLAFNLRDVRGGGKQKRSIQTVLNWLYNYHLDYFDRIVGLVPEYGYWKDLISYTNSKKVRTLIQEQLDNDSISDHPSLLAKWMPSTNAGKASRLLGLEWAKILGVSEPQYRRAMASLKKRIKPVESVMSAGNWELIEYSKVPSVAMKNYGGAFAKHDHARFDAFIKAAVRGDVKINAATLLPHEIAFKYTKNRWGNSQIDDVTEAQWKALQDYTNGEDVLCMPDMSDSMTWQSFGKTTTREVAISLAIYFAQRNTGAFKNQFVTFSSSPVFVTLHGTTLFENIQEVFNQVVGGNTDILKTVQAILDLAIRNRVPQNQMPKKLLVISDMQFDRANQGQSSFEAIRAKYKKAGYEMPEIIFWNANSNIQTTSPVTKDEKGVALVSGASPATLQYVLGAHIDTPMETMMKCLNDKRYEPVRKALGV